MRKFLQNKLWRDKAVEILEAQGSRVHWRQLNDAEFDVQLRLKLLEEAHEVKVAQTMHDLKAELADVFEVIETLCKLHGISRDEVKQIQEEKRRERGVFEGRKYVTVAEHSVGSFGEKYCLAAPDKYSEIL